MEDCRLQNQIILKQAYQSAGRRRLGRPRESLLDDVRVEIEQANVIT
jgi:hypothetical protein